MQKTDLLHNIKAAVSAGYLCSDKEEIARLYEILFPGSKICRECSSDLIHAYNSLRQYVRKQEISIQQGTQGQ
jgi:hypothetical protein